jgi:drug/metabolite transporter (DMT)-like permease
MDAPQGEAQGTAAAAAAERQRGNLAGILAMVMATVSFTAGDLLMKIAADHLPTGELVFLRGLMVMWLALVAAAVAGALDDLRRLLTIPAMAGRASGDVGGAIFFQAALARMPFADIMAILQVTPLTLTAASALMLGERVGWRRWSAVAIGLLGALLIIKPGSSAFNWWAIAGIAAVLCGAYRDVSTRRIAPGISPLTIMVLSSAAVTLAALSLALFEEWRWPGARLLGLVAGCAVLSLLGHLAVIRSVRLGEISAIAPFRYCSIVWAIAAGYAVWGELPDRVSATGIVTVIMAGLYTLYREHALRRRAGLAPARRPR